MVNLFKLIEEKQQPKQEIRPVYRTKLERLCDDTQPILHENIADTRHSELSDDEHASLSSTYAKDKRKFVVKPRQSGKTQSKPTVDLETIQSDRDFATKGKYTKTLQKSNTTASVYMSPDKPEFVMPKATEPTQQAYEQEIDFEIAKTKLEKQTRIKEQIKIILNEQQEYAIDLFERNKHALLIGYAGTGKTTAVNEMLNRLCFDADKAPKANMLMSQQHKTATGHLKLPANRTLNIAICAFTGMAVKQLKSKLYDNFEHYEMHKHCYTIHKLIDYGPIDEEVWDDEKGQLVVKRKFIPRKDKHNKLPFDIVIIDEISMVGDYLMKELLEALPENTRIYGIGDIAQIPPIFAESTMLPMLTKWPIAELTTIYRQKDGSIIDNANRIREGQKPLFNEACIGHKLDNDRKKAQAQFLNHMKKEFKEGKYDPNKDIILCTNNRNQLGQELMNIQMRKIVNPNADKLVNVKTMRQTKQYALGDRVMVVKNDNTSEVFNGMIGVVVDIAPNINYTMDYHVPFEGLAAFNEDDVIAQIEEEQRRVASEKKLLALVGEANVHNFVEDKDDDNGTGKREASHTVTVMFPDEDNRKVRFSTSSGIENLIPAWVITTHKSQGSGFRNVYFVLHNSGGNLLFNELFYTGFTRCEQKIVLFTTEFAMMKAINRRTIEGNTLDEKLKWFKANMKGDERDYDYLPYNRLLERVL